MYELPEVIVGDTNVCCHAAICFSLHGGITVTNDKRRSPLARKFVLNNMGKMRITERINQEFTSLTHVSRRGNLLQKACERAGVPDYEADIRENHTEVWSQLLHRKKWLEFEPCMRCMEDGAGGKYKLNSEYKNDLKRIRDLIWRKFSRIFYSNKDLYNAWYSLKNLDPKKEPPDTPDGCTRDPAWPAEYPPSNNDLGILAAAVIFARRCNLRVGVFTFDKDIKLIFDALAGGVFKGDMDDCPIRDLDLIWGDDLERYM